jgi:outer membrane protein TolC
VTLRANVCKILRRAGPASLLAILVLPGGACRSAAEWREHADAEVYSLLDARRAKLFAEPGGFRIDPPTGSMREAILAGDVAQLQVSLVQCLEIAAENSRDYQARKEQLYLSALDLTFERWRFHPRPFGSVDATVDGTGGEAETATVDGNLGLATLLGNGASLVTNIGASLFRFLSTGDGWDALSALSFSFTQPLLAGSGKLVAQESLTQAERNLIYAVRDFERFRRTFAFEVATRYYALLETVEQLENQRRNFANLIALRERNEALAQAGRITDIQVDQAKQDELRSQNEVLSQEAELARRLDTFKLFLGLPVPVSLSADPSGFALLTEADEVLDHLTLDMATEVALRERLDFLNLQGSLEDRKRRVLIAEDDLRAALDLSLAGNVSSPEGQPTSISTGDSVWTAGLGLTLPLDRLAQRNAYRQSLIDEARTERDVEEQSDQIQAVIRDALRTTSTTRESYQIQIGAVQLAERRVESAELSLLAGRSSTRDLLDSQEDLLTAQNAQTSALIDFSLARLGLYLGMELLRVDDQGIQVDTSLLAASAENGQ